MNNKPPFLLRVCHSINLKFLMSFENFKTKKKLSPEKQLNMKTVETCLLFMVSFNVSKGN